MKRAILAVVLFSFLPRLVDAAPRTCRIVFPERPKDAPKSAFLYDGTRNIAVTLPSMTLSEVIELPAGEINIALVSKEISEPETLPPAAPRLKIPEALQDFYIIILPDPNNRELPVRMNLVDTGEGKLKAGETLWFNFTEHKIVGKLGEARMSIDPRGKTITASPVNKNGYYAARFAYQPGGQGEPAPITEQSWWHDDQTRYLGFIANSGGKLPKIYFFRDFRSPDLPDASEVQE
jgi:hypothetical protein